MRVCEALQVINKIASDTLSGLLGGGGGMIQWHYINCFHSQGGVEVKWHFGNLKSRYQELSKHDIFALGSGKMAIVPGRRFFALTFGTQSVQGASQ